MRPPGFFVPRAAQSGTALHARASRFRGDETACVVLASKGYPDRYRTGIPIHGLGRARERRDTVVFHAGTKGAGEEIVTSGGRVLAVTGIDHDGDVTAAVARAYDAIGDIHFEGMHYRTDIGRKGLKRW